jgi:hypothetical protein
MRMLSVQIEVSPAGSNWPQHLGGVLHGFVEGAILNHAPQWLGHLRPLGDQGPAGFTIHAPPATTDATPGDMLRFGVVLFGTLGEAVEDVGQAMAAQCARRLQGRVARLIDVQVIEPDLSATAFRTASRLHRLTLRSPLLLASRGASREGLRTHGQLPWPSLGSVLDSIAQRARLLEPSLARLIGLTSDWRASEVQRATEALTPASAPAQQVAWTYSATPRRSQRSTEPPSRRQLPLPGIVGTLLYPASDDPLESALLHWGQWIGVGQKTTMGCGSYVWEGL